MEQKKQRSRSGGPARRRVKSANAEAVAVASSAEQQPSFGERAAAPSGTSEEAIRTRAYYLFLERGARSGHELDDWLRAERETRP
ncbi:MAG TPA: DUF2934 domain-containing protein [Gemmatimonadaceae bacterium]|nr:DUF2934 domain-containing protein [Gemmatimonadaceae bacterium]